MAEETPSGPAPVTTTSAGSLLRKAREAQGLHIAVLAASLKVPQRKLEALERDRLDELPDATFARALAQTVCRALKIDAAPVLALLPRVDAAGLDHVADGLNMPFREKSGAAEPAVRALVRHPATAIVTVLLVAAAAVWFWPRGAGLVAPPSPSAPSASEPAVATPEPAALPVDAVASAPAVETAASAPLVETVHSAPPMADAASAASEPAAAAAALLSLRASSESWVEVIDSGGRTLLSRTVQAGERVGLDGTPPLRLTIGNAEATEILFRGQAVDLQPSTRDNIARLELK